MSYIDILMRVSYVWLVVYLYIIRQLLVALLLTQGYYRDNNFIVYLHIAMGQINPDGFKLHSVLSSYVFFCNKTFWDWVLSLIPWLHDYITTTTTTTTTTTDSAEFGYIPARFTTMLSTM